MSRPTFCALISVDLYPVPLTDVFAYLERTGWQREDISTRMVAWRRDDSYVDTPAVVLADYHRRLVEVVQGIAFAESRPEVDVARDLGMLSAPAPAPEGS